MELIRSNRPLFFFITMIISLVGNACADYAILWYTIDHFKLDGAQWWSDPTGLFYVGQALGAILLAPQFSVLFDRFKKLHATIGLDILYGILLICGIVLFRSGLLESFSIFILVSLITMVSTVYRSSVGFSVIKHFESEAPKLVSNLIVAITLSNLFGAGLSGIFYKWLGFEGALIFGIVTFIPSLLIYRYIFADWKAEGEVRHAHYLRDLKEGWQHLKDDPYLLNIALGLGLFNIGGALIPVFLGISLKSQNLFEGQAFGLIVGLGLLIGITPLKFFRTISSKVKLSRLFLYSILPSSLFALSWVLIDQTFVFWALVYVFACLGSTFRNITTGQIRVLRIPKQALGRVNTLYSSILSTGQILGGLVLVPIFKNDMVFGTWFLIVVFIISMGWGLLKVPGTRLEDLAAHE